MSAEIRDFVSRCTICQTYKHVCFWAATFLIMVDYWCSFFEVVQIHKDPHSPEGGWDNQKELPAHVAHMKLRWMDGTSAETPAITSVKSQQWTTAQDWERKQVTKSDWEWKQITCFARACTRSVPNPICPCDSGTWHIVLSQEPITSAHSVSDSTDPVPALLPRRSGQTRGTST